MFMEETKENLRRVQAPAILIDWLLAQGMLASTGTAESEPDLIEAHKWFNLAVVKGSVLAAQYRQEISKEMCLRDIAEAQCRARLWLSSEVEERQDLVA
ncbi:hypothetical protein [Polycladidibacter hongkongensis]|uniref:hypothetical protein n=1 Tax=Polycladidibacter hongkongensis TaxID=1647556 RepID=UPI00082E094F|nr:hypothetical protein [Pseudovibrio hongkongensis]